MNHQQNTWKTTCSTKKTLLPRIHSLHFGPRKRGIEEHHIQLLLVVRCGEELQRPPPLLGESRGPRGPRGGGSRRGEAPYLDPAEIRGRGFFMDPGRSTGAVEKQRRRHEVPFDLSEGPLLRDGNS